MSNPDPTRLDPRTRFRPASARNASSSPSRSPSRQAQFVAQEIDPLLDNLSPLSTLKALNLTDAIGKRPAAHADLLTRSIGEATTTERAQGIRAAVAAQKLREWHGEVLAWKWPAKKDKILGKGFEPRLPAGRQNGTTKEKKEYLGSLPKAVVIHHEERIEEIKDGLEALHVEELKEHVLRAHTSPNDKERKINGVVQLSDFTAVITHTILQALPYLSKLTALLNDWDVRIMVLKQVPLLLRQLEKTEAIVDFASDNARSRRTSCLLTRQTFKETKAALEHDVSIIGAIFDKLLDLLEGRDDALPDAWIDRMDKLEARWGSWTAEAEKKVLFNEWLKESGSFIVNHSKMQQSQGPNTPTDLGTVHPSTQSLFPEAEGGLDGLATEQDRLQREEIEQPRPQVLARAGDNPFKMSSDVPSPSTADTSVSLPILHGKIGESMVEPGQAARRPTSSPETRQLSRGHNAEKGEIRGINTALDHETSAVTSGLPLGAQRTPHVQHARGASLPDQQPWEVSALVVGEDVHQDGSHDQSKSFSAENDGSSDVMQPRESLSRVRDAEKAENSCTNLVEPGSETLHTAGILLAAEASSDPPNIPNIPTSKQPLSSRLPRPVHHRTRSEMSMPRSIASEAFSDLSNAEIGSATTAEALGSPKVIRHSVKLSQEGVANSMAADSLPRTASMHSPRHEMQQYIQSRNPGQELTSVAADQGASTQPVPTKSTDIVTNSDHAGASPRPTTELSRAGSVVAPDSVSRSASDYSDRVIPDNDAAKSRRGSTSTAPVSPVTPVDPTNPFPISDTPRSVSSLASGSLAHSKLDLSQHSTHIVREDRLSPPHDAGRIYLAGSDDEQRIVPVVPRRSSKRLPIPSATPPSRIPPPRTAPPRTPGNVTKKLVQPNSTPRTQDGSAQSHRRQRSSSHHIASQALPSGVKGKQTRDLLQSRIQNLVTDMSDRIRLLSASEAGSPRVTPIPTSSRSASPWPPLILSPVKSKRQTAPNYSSAPSSDVRMFHLTRRSDPPGTPPTKLFVRLIGPNGERVMVRVGGGWADLGDYLENYSLHRSARVRDGDESYELASIPVSGRKESFDRRVIAFGTRSESRTDVTPSPLPTVNAVLPEQQPLPGRPSSGLSRRSSSASLREAFKSVKRRLSISSLRSDRSRGTSPAPSVTDHVEHDSDNWGWNTPASKFRPQIRTFHPYHDNDNWDGKPQRVVIASNSQTSLNTAPPSSASSSYMQPYQYQSGQASPAPSTSSAYVQPYQYQPQHQPQPHLRRGHTSPKPTPKVSNYPPAYRHQQSYQSPTADPSNFPVRKHTVMHGYRPYTADTDHAPAPNIGPTGKLSRKPSLILRGRRRSSVGEGASSGIRRVFFRKKAD